MFQKFLAWFKSLMESYKTPMQVPFTIINSAPPKQVEQNSKRMTSAYLEAYDTGIPHYRTPEPEKKPDRCVNDSYDTLSTLATMVLVDSLIDSSDHTCNGTSDISPDFDSTSIDSSPSFDGGGGDFGGGGSSGDW